MANNTVQCSRCGVFTTVNFVRNVSDSAMAAHYINENGFKVLIGVIQCGSCSRLLAIDDYKVVWPITTTPPPEGVPEIVQESYKDARLAHAAGANIAALMAGRITLERLVRDQKASNYKDLAERQIITPTLFKAADQIRRWANFVGHEDLDPGTFNSEEVEEILGYLGTVLEAVYTHPARVAALARRTREVQQQNERVE